jgi:hypothetical protein
MGKKESEGMNVIRNRVVSLVMLSVLTIGVIACGASPSSTLDETAVRAYADPATEVTLQGMSENNLTKYTQYGDSQFKAAVTQEMMNQVSGQLAGQVGTYVSKEFLRAEAVQVYVTVHYRAKYSKGELGVRMVFDKDGLVAGQFFE